MKTAQIRQIRRYYRWFFIGVCLFGLFGLIYKAPIPASEQILPVVLEEPIQTKITKPVFEYVRLGKSFWVEPTHDYEISGVVVSKNHMKSLLDPSYVKYDARIQDFCIIWGENATSGVMEDIKVRNSNFTCHYFSPKPAIWEQFNPDQLSNNHILAENPEEIRTLKRIEIGDQITLKGNLANYYMDKDLKYLGRKTSTIRTDDGDGACETFFVDSAEILQRSTPLITLLITIAHRIFFWSVAGFIGLWLLECFWEAHHTRRRK